MTVAAELVRAVTARAGRRCEYCRMHQALQGATFHIEHIRPVAQGGVTALDNLALACPSCNLHKSDRVAAAVPGSADVAPLFNPRTDRWEGHFVWHGHRVLGLTPIGRATAAALDLNHPRRILIREAEELFRLFPP